MQVLRRDHGHHADRGEHDQHRILELHQPGLLEVVVAERQRRGGAEQDHHLGEAREAVVDERLPSKAVRVPSGWKPTQSPTSDQDDARRPEHRPRRPRARRRRPRSAPPSRRPPAPPPGATRSGSRPASRRVPQFAASVGARSRQRRLGMVDQRRHRGADGVEHQRRIDPEQRASPRSAARRSASRAGPCPGSSSGSP